VISVKLTLNFKDGGDPPVYLVKMVNSLGDWWLVDAGRWSDMHRDGIVFADRRDAEAAIGLVESRLRLQDRTRGYREPCRLSVVKFNSKGI
jgi:hypothetical protein